MTVEEVHQSFADFLTSRRLLSEDQLRGLTQDLRTPSADPNALRKILCDGGLMSEEDSVRALADFYGYPYINMRHTTIDPSAIGKVSSDFARRHTVMPFNVCQNEISVAFATLDLTVVDLLSAQTGCTVLVHFSSDTLIREAIEIHYRSSEIIKAASEIDISQLLEDPGQSNRICELADALIVHAIKERASDIHVEPTEGDIRIRYRVDGMLREAYELPVDLLRHLVARFKIMATLDITETRLTQDGRIEFTVGARRFDLRVSIVPSQYGEKTVIRILDKQEVTLDLDSMFFSRAVRNHMETVASSPNGVIFLTGPTGSGKTTTCYAILNHLNTLERNIVTIEDPIEYRIPMINQIQVRHEIGLGFADILRAVLRQDPDVILVGEIRDLETARTAMEAALTGHLVLSTLHTNNAVQAVVRLVEMGVEPFLVAPTIVGVMGQRLVRRICGHCRETYAPSPSELRCLGATPESQQNILLYRGTGCDRCRGTGYFGRLPVHELVVVVDEIRALIMSRAPVLEIERAAYSSGYKPMRYDGLKKALLGFTTLSEVLRVTPVKGDFVRSEKPGE